MIFENVVLAYYDRVDRNDNLLTKECLKEVAKKEHLLVFDKKRRLIGRITALRVENNALVGEIYLNNKKFNLKENSIRLCGTIKSKNYEVHGNKAVAVIDNLKNLHCEPFPSRFDIY